MVMNDDDDDDDDDGNDDDNHVDNYDDDYCPSDIAIALLCFHTKSYVRASRAYVQALAPCPPFFVTIFAQ